MARLVFLSLLLNGVIAAIVWFVPTIVMLGLFLLVIPGLILGAIPTLFLYQAMVGLPWLLFRHKGEVMVLGGAITFALLFAVGTPIVLNSTTNAELAAANASILIPPQPLAPVSTISILNPNRAKAPRCDVTCQLLLLNGNAREVILLAAKPDQVAQSFRLTEEGPCAAKAAELLRSDSQPAQLATVLPAFRYRMAGGACLASETVANPVADLEIRVIENRASLHNGTRLAAHPVRLSGIEIVRDQRVVARHLSARATLFRSVLYLNPVFAQLNATGWEWGARLPEEDKLLITDHLARLTSFRLDMPAELTPDQVRDRIDDVLNDPTLPAASMLLAADYNVMLYRGVEQEDVKRVGRMIVDPRLTNFDIVSTATTKKNADAALGEPMLRRLAQMAKTDDPQYGQLESMLERLPEGTFSRPSKALDELLSIDAALVRSPNVIARLAEQGAAGQQRVLAILGRFLDQPKPGRQQENTFRDISRSFCRMHERGAVLLPALRQLHDSHLDHEFTRMHVWRGALVSLGASPDDFTAFGSWKPQAYRQNLVSTAKSCR